MSVENFTDELQENREQDCIEADEILERLVSENRKPTPAEKAYLLARMGWDEKATSAQVRRMGNVVTLRKIAGTAADREAMAEQASTARAALDKEGPKLREAIAKAEAKLRQLESDATRAERRSQEQAEAVAKLRSFAPIAIAEQVRARQTELDFGIVRELQDAEGRDRQLRACIDRGLHQSDADHLDCVERNAPSAVTRNRDRKCFSAGWPAIKAAMEAEAAELAPKIDELKKQIAHRQAEIDRGLDYYS